MKPRILTDSEVVYALLTNAIVVTPLLSKSQVGATLDLRLGTEFVVKKMDRLTHIDPIWFNQLERSDPEVMVRFYETVKLVDPTTAFVLHPGQFALGCTLEYIDLPPQIGGMLEGRSSWAREGLNVHSTAGLIHPGHKGVIVFELLNAGSHPIPLYPGIRVAQLLLYELDSVTRQPYGLRDDSKYSRYVATNFGRPWADWEFECLGQKSRRRPAELKREEQHPGESERAQPEQGRSETS